MTTALQPTSPRRLSYAHTLRWKRNKKVAIKPLRPVLTVLHLDLCSSTHHSPSWL